MVSAPSLVFVVINAPLSFQQHLLSSVFTATQQTLDDPWCLVEMFCEMHQLHGRHCGGGVVRSPTRRLLRWHDSTMGGDEKGHLKPRYPAVTSIHSGVGRVGNSISRIMTNVASADMKEHFVIDPLISKRQQLLLATQLCRMVLKVRIVTFGVS